MGIVIWFEESDQVSSLEKIELEEAQYL